MRYLLLIALIALSNVIPSLGLQTSENISSYGTIISREGGYVYVSNGKFFHGVKELHFFGTAIVLSDTYTFKEDDFAHLKRKGINAIRIAINWAKLEPRYREYDLSYVNRLRDCRDWCEKYGIYMFIDFHQWGDVYTPIWVGKWLRIFNGNSTSEFTETWKYVAGSIFNNSKYVACYEVPYNEPDIFWISKDDYTDLENNGFNVTREWQNWLKKRYSSIDSLNKTWNHNTIDQIKATEAKTDFTGIVAPCKFTGTGDHWDCARKVDWGYFCTEFLVNFSVQIAYGIKQVDQKHVLSFQFSDTRYLPFALSLLPKNLFMAYTIHSYLDRSTNLSYYGAAMNSHLLQVQSMRSLNSTMAFYVGEWSAGSGVLAEEQACGLTLAQSFCAGADSIVHWNWWSTTSTHPENLFVTGGDWQGYYKTYMPVFEPIFSNGVSSIQPKVALVVGSAFYDEILTGVSAQLMALRVPFKAYPDTYVGSHPECLNEMRVVIVQSYDAISKSCILNLKTWAQGDIQNRHVLWLSLRGNMNEYFQGNANLYGLLDGYLWKGPHSSDFWHSQAATGTDTLDFYHDFGDIPSGTSLSFFTCHAINDWKKNMVLGVNGLTPIANLTISNTLALWTMNNSAYFSGWISRNYDYVPENYNDSSLSLLRAFLKWSGEYDKIGLEEITSLNLMYRYSNGHLIVYERFGRGGTYSVKMPNDAMLNLSFRPYEVKVIETIPK